MNASLSCLASGALHGHIARGGYCAGLRNVHAQNNQPKDKEEPKLGWSNTSDLSLVVTGGNSESASLGFSDQLRSRRRSAVQSNDVPHKAGAGARCGQLPRRRRLRAKDFYGVVLERRCQLVSRRRRRNPEPVPRSWRRWKHLGRQPAATLRDQLWRELHRPRRGGARSGKDRRFGGARGIIPSTSMQRRRSTAISGRTSISPTRLTTL